MRLWYSCQGGQRSQTTDNAQHAEGQDHARHWTLLSCARMGHYTTFTLLSVLTESNCSRASRQLPDPVDPADARAVATAQREQKHTHGRSMPQKGRGPRDLL